MIMFPGSPFTSTVDTIRTYVEVQGEVPATNQGMGNKSGGFSFFERVELQAGRPDISGLRADETALAELL
jgi:hypothetical protein